MCGCRLYNFVHMGFFAMEIRIKGAMPRMQALKEVEKTDAVNTLVAICAICKSQFSKVFIWVFLHIKSPYLFCSFFFY
jgi:hypothetical protein